MRQSIPRIKLLLYESFLEKIFRAENSCKKSQRFLNNPIYDFSAHPEIQSVVGIDRVVRDSLNGLISYGDVHDIQYASNSFNLVLNVESSHYYADLKKFIQEVERVLKPGGYFCWTGFAVRNEVRSF
jgi:SAM-dependent methyltransferase